MKIAAVYEFNGKVLKTTNLDKKLSKLKDIPRILYKCENGSEADLDKWIKDNLSSNFKEQDELDVILHHYINRKTRYTITSIYDNLNENGYERID